jgi:hypothetical protein
MYIYAVWAKNYKKTLKLSVTRISSHLFYKLNLARKVLQSIKTFDDFGLNVSL